MSKNFNDERAEIMERLVRITDDLIDVQKLMIGNVEVEKRKISPVSLPVPNFDDQLDQSEMVEKDKLYLAKKDVDKENFKPRRRHRLGSSIRRRLNFGSKNNENEEELKQVIMGIDNINL